VCRGWVLVRGGREKLGPRRRNFEIVRICIIRSFIRVSGSAVLDLPGLGVVDSSGQAAVAEIHHAVPETALVQQLEVQPRPFTATDHNRRHEQVALVARRATR